MNDNEKHIQVISHMIEIATKYEGSDPGSTSCALIASKNALEQETKLKELLTRSLKVLDIVLPPSELHEELRKALGYKWCSQDGLLGGFGYWKKVTAELTECSPNKKVSDNT